MTPQDTSFPRLVSLACHDLRTPLATVFGFARTIQRAEPEGEQLARYVEMIVAASAEMTALLEELSIAARIEDGRYEPTIVSTDTLLIAQEALPDATGAGAPVETDPNAAVRSIAALGSCMKKHGAIDAVSTTVDGPTITIEPVEDACRTIVTGEHMKDLGAAVAQRVLRALGAEVQVDGAKLRISFAAGSGS